MAKISATVLAARKSAEGTYPIFVRIAAKKEKAYIKTQYEISDLCQWYNGKIVARSDASLMNKRILFEIKKYKERIEEIENYDTYTATQLKLIITQKDKVTQSASTFTDFLRKRISELVGDGRNGHAKMLQETLRVFLLAEGELPFVIMNHITIEHFDNWMKRKSYSDGNRQIRLSQIKARVNEAIRYGLIKCEIHPFAYTKIPTPDIRELDISISDFIKIRDSDVTQSKRYTIAKDMFLLSFYIGGANLADIVQMDFSGNEVDYMRKKSSEHRRRDRVTRIPIQLEARVIINKYIGEGGLLELGYKFTYGNLCRYINSCLKKLAKDLNLQSNISFYSARKTFAQFASEIAIPYPIIEYCLGHSVKRNYQLLRKSQTTASRCSDKACY